MKIHISRQMVYVLGLATAFLIFVFVFAFTVLIPIGKDYRVSRMDVKKATYSVDIIQNEYDRVYKKLKNLQTENQHIIGAYKSIFNPDRFKKIYEKHFESFSLTALDPHSQDGEFTVYEVNTSNLILSPQGFYDFLDAVNKSDNIVSINFPIHFEREANLIKSSFTMRVYVAGKPSKEQ